MSRYSFFASCAPGLEPVLHAEAKALQLARLERQVGGVYFEGQMADAWRANLWLRSAVRVLLRLGRFEALDGDQLHRGASELDWAGWLAPGATLAVAAHSKESALDHTLFIEQRVKDAVVDQARQRGRARPSVDLESPDLLIHAHVYRDRCTLLVDTSGESLHKRGWRRFQGRAPLAETTAAAVVLLSGWDRRAPLLDPFCGSATLLIEAALLAAEAAPGLFRERFGFERWPGHDAAGWQRAKQAARARRKPLGKLVLRGSDIDAETLAGARENAAAAGFADALELSRADARDFAPKRGWNACVLSNLPYGKRVGDRGESDLAALYRAFGARLAEHCHGYTLGLLSGDARLERELGWRPERVIELQNGALECRLLCGPLPSVAAHARELPRG